jgi:hypothetical protein
MVLISCNVRLQRGSASRPVMVNAAVTPSAVPG